MSKSPQSGYYDKTGRVAIGNMTAPKAKLHIDAADDEDATLFLQPSNWTQDNVAAVWFGDSLHSISAEIDKGLVYQTEEDHIFKGGNVYIEDIDKGIIMKSPDGRCWLGTLDNNGSLNFNLLEACPGEPVGISESSPSETDMGLKVYPNPAGDYLNIEIKNPNHLLFTISLLDEKGNEALIKNIYSGKTQVYTGDLKTGIYFVRVTGNGKKMVEKVVRQ